MRELRYCVAHTLTGRYVLGGNVKKVSYLLLGLLSTSVLAEPNDGLIGTYLNSDKLSCNLEVKLFEKQGRNYFEVKIEKRLLSGEYILDEQYVIFEGLTASEASGLSNLEVSAQIESGQLLFQNYGNSMNPYTLFSECAEKYLILSKVLT